MGKYENDEGNVSTVMDIYNLVFPEETREKIDALHLSFADLKVVIEAATDLIMGTGEESPEGQTHTTTSSKITT